MNSVEKFEKQLPQYLSYESRKRLFEALSQFPNNIDNRLYTKFLENEEIIFQGDGIKDILFVDLPSKNSKIINAMIISNSCDINPQNNRYLTLNATYCPIVSLDNYEHLLTTKGIDEEKIKQQVKQIKRQEISNLFYLPRTSSIPDSIVFFDRINSIDVDWLYEKDLGDARLFTLSDYGFYLFLYKLSIHFTRIWERIERRID